MSAIYDACPPVPPAPDTPTTFPNQGETAQCFSPTRYYNSAQTAVNTCGSPPYDPSTLSYTVLADNILSDIDQSTADLLAMALAVNTVNALRVATPCQLPASLLLTEDGNYVILEDFSTYIELSVVVNFLLSEDGKFIILEDLTTALALSP